jgi:hypothetical protein
MGCWEYGQCGRSPATPDGGGIRPAVSCRVASRLHQPLGRSMRGSDPQRTPGGQRRTGGWTRREDGTQTAAETTRNRLPGEHSRRCRRDGARHLPSPGQIRLPVQGDNP